jgi:enoyl-CoA hydratase
MESESEILCETRGEAGVITLNRPRALNALTLGMVREMRRALDAWAGDPAITRIVVRGAGEKAFCAGGDIRRLTELGLAGQAREALDFWREEYQLNALIKTYPKPYISLIDGIVMGGGVGISLHGPYRVAGERYLFAMPEVGIGFFPDVGATYALPRLPGQMGRYIALTGERIKRPDAMFLGLATHAVDGTDFDALLDELAAGAPVERALAARAVEPGEAPLCHEAALIDRCFQAESVAAILECLARDDSEPARRMHRAIATKSPTSLSLTLEQMRRGGTLSFAEAMKTEFRIVSRIFEGRDFFEGVRAVLIDKDGDPQWQPADLGAIDKAAIERYFADLGPDELEIA